MRHRFAVGLALVPMLMAGACAGGGESSGPASTPFGQVTPKAEEEQPDQARLRVTEVGEATNFYAYVENPEDREVAAEVEFTAFDAEGNTYKESAGTKPDEKYEIFPPKSTIAVALFVVMKNEKGGREPDKFTRVEARLIPKKRSDIPEHKPGKFEAGPVSMQAMEGASFMQEAVVEVTNGYPQDVKTGVLVVMCKDAKGKVTDASSTQFSAAANEKKKVKLSGSKGETCTAYPRMSNNTKFGS